MPIFRSDPDPVVRSRLKRTTARLRSFIASTFDEICGSV